MYILICILIAMLTVLAGVSCLAIKAHFERKQYWGQYRKESQEIEDFRARLMHQNEEFLWREHLERCFAMDPMGK